ncbi:MAG: BatD family protein [Planctomycetes bacterium]|nr:BatD family protein [Planctomycetota bacterium]
MQITTHAAPNPCVVGQVVALRVRVAIETRFLTAHVLQPFRRPLDVPVALQAAWLETLAGTALLAPKAPAQPATLAANGRVVEAARLPDQVVGEQRFAVFELQRRCVPQHAGPLRLSAPRLELAHASRFVDDLVHGRKPVDRRTAVLTGQPVLLEVRELPRDGRPAGFTGAVGALQLIATAAPTAIARGTVVKLGLRIVGAADPRAFPAPRPTAAQGWHVLGELDSLVGAERHVTYDLAPLRADVGVIPALELVYFDPGSGRYSTARSAAIPVTVAKDAVSAVRVAPTADDGAALHPIKPSTPPAPSLPHPRSGVLLAVWAVLPWLLAFTLRSLLRARVAWHTQSLRARRGREAAAALRTRLATDPQGAESALAGYLAVRLGVPTAAVFSHDLAARLQRAGISAPLAEATARCVEDLGATRFGGTLSDNPQDVGKLVDRLEQEFP